MRKRCDLLTSDTSSRNANPKYEMRITFGRQVKSALLYVFLFYDMTNLAIALFYDKSEMVGLTN